MILRKSLELTSIAPNPAHDTPVAWRGMMVMKAVQQVSFCSLQLHHIHTELIHLQLLFDVDWTSSNGSEPLDALVIDMPPGTGDIQISLGQLVSVDGKSRIVPL